MNDISAPLTSGAAVPQRPAPTPKDIATAREFEAVFVGQMARLMLDSVDQGDFSGGNGEQVFRGILAEKIGGEIARAGGIGIAPAVLDQILKLQGSRK
ncbi:rod-binding protein [uncultured Sphingomonas sp.]|uniref:rod-binding protein n=1 Tax=uncultured Sphingomonas sp. TaxID=158754 RepID=UPI002635B0CD|nr:rod-binding protein [uncultured Sphingomonas sp.]